MNILTKRTANAMQVSRLTVEAMRTPTVMVVDSSRVKQLQAQITELETQVEALQAKAKALAKARRAKAARQKKAQKERIDRAERLEAATIKQGGRSYAPEHEVPMLSLLCAVPPSAAIGSRKVGVFKRWLRFWR